MGSKYQDVIRGWYPLPVDPGSSTFVFEVGSTVNSFDIFSSASGVDEQTVWYASQGGIDPDELQFVTPRHLFLEIENLINDTFVGGHGFDSFSPNSHVSDTGVKLVRSSGSTSFSWRFDHSNWTLDPRVLGFSQDRSSRADSSNGEIVPPYSYLGACHFDGKSVPPAKDFRSETDRRRFESNIDKRYAYANEWTPQRVVDPADRDQDFGVFRTSKVRRLRLQHVPPARILNYLADDSFEADQAGISQGDRQTSIDHFWENSEIGPLFLDLLWKTSGSDLHNLDTSANDGKAEMVAIDQTSHVRRLRDAVEDSKDGQRMNVDMPLRQGSDTVDH